MRHRLFFLLIAAAGLIVGLALVGYFKNSSAAAGCEEGAGSLSNASVQELEARAQNYACVWLAPKGDMTTRFAQFITPEEYMSYFGENARLCQDEKIAMVILQGDFGWNLPGAGQMSPEAQKEDPRGSFVGIVFDVKSGDAFQITRSDGSMFREILNDPSLPEYEGHLVPTPETLPPCIDPNQVQPTLMPPSK